MERIIEILLFVLSEYEKNVNPQEIDITQLVRQGYTDTEISTAFSWLYDNYSTNDTKLTRKENAFRILHDTERILFTQRAWGDIQQMVHLGLLTNTEVENIIEKAAFSGHHKIDSKHVKTYVAYNIFGSGNNINKVFLSDSETIN